MDPAVRTIAISCATAIIGYISSSLLNMRAARPMSHEAAALAPRPEVGCLAPPHEAPLQRRHCTRVQLWRHCLARAHPRAHSTHQAPPPGPALCERAWLRVHRMCTRAHVQRMCTQAQQHLGRVERVNEQVTRARVGDTNPTPTPTPNQLKELCGPLLA